METDISDIEEAIVKAYTSLESPNFSFVMRNIDSKPYEKLVEKLSRNYILSEDTDPNYDVSFIFNVERGNQSWLLKLSMVGLFACLIRYSKTERPTAILSDATKDLTDEEIELKSELSRFGFRLMTRSEMERPIRLQMFLVDIDNTRIYHALFCDAYYFPWD